MSQYKIERVKDGSGDIHFRVETPEGPSTDIVLTRIEAQMADPHEFELNYVPDDAMVYRVQTHGLGDIARVMWVVSEKCLFVVTLAPKRMLKNYIGSSLDDCILTALREHALT